MVLLENSWTSKTRYIPVHFTHHTPSYHYHYHFHKNNYFHVLYNYSYWTLDYLASTSFGKAGDGFNSEYCWGDNFLQDFLMLVRHSGQQNLRFDQVSIQFS